MIHFWCFELAKTIQCGYREWSESSYLSQWSFHLTLGSLRCSMMSGTDNTLCVTFPGRVWSLWSWCQFMNVYDLYDPGISSCVWNACHLYGSCLTSPLHWVASGYVWGSLGKPFNFNIFDIVLKSTGFSLTELGFSFACICSRRTVITF